jgi:hypothetical protein
MPFESNRQPQLEIITKHIQSFSSLQVSHFFIYETLWEKFSNELTSSTFVDANPATLSQFVQWLKSKQD